MTAAIAQSFKWLSLRRQDQYESLFVEEREEMKRAKQRTVALLIISYMFVTIGGILIM